MYAEGYDIRIMNVNVSNDDEKFHFLQGGTLIEYEGKQRLLEIAQVPKEHVSCEIEKTSWRWVCYIMACCSLALKNWRSSLLNTVSIAITWNLLLTRTFSVPVQVIFVPLITQTPDNLKLFQFPFEGLSYHISPCTRTKENTKLHQGLNWTTIN